eukprot:356704-Chlamydomonas_euryale.AAC.7
MAATASKEKNRESLEDRPECARSGQRYQAAYARRLAQGHYWGPSEDSHQVCATLKGHRCGMNEAWLHLTLAWLWHD